MTIRRVAQVLERADITISDLTTDGGLLLPEQSDQFLDEIQEQPTMLSQVRVIRMNSHTVKINKIGFASRIMKAANQSGQAEDDGSNARILAKADRSRVTTRQIELISREVMAEVHIPYEVLEDNIERGNFETHVLRLIAERSAQDLEEWIITADKSSGDAYLALQDGLLISATSNVVDNLNAGLTPDTFRDAQLAMPQRYLRNLANMRNFVTVQDAIRYRSNVAARATGFGDSALQSAAQINAFGAPVEPTPFMAANTALFTIPQNILFGIHRDIMVESERNIRSRELIIVLSTRIDVTYEDEQAVVKITNIN